jgi:type IV pilus assembly protein PilE
MADYRPIAEPTARRKLQYVARAPGFTLLELMITVAIVAILVAIAVSSYEFAMVKTRRGAAEGCLMEAAQYMERYYTTNITYLGATVPRCSTDVTPHYTIALSGTPDARSYTILATPVSGSRQEKADTKCATLGVDQTGTKTASGPAGVAGCW